MEFPSLEDILADHDRILERYGGAAGILAPGAIETAIERARWGPFEGTGELFERSAFLLRGIAQDHPFWDGNKRTAFDATHKFLRANGHRLIAPPDAVITFMLDVAQARLTLQEMAVWLCAHAKFFPEDA